MSGVYTEQQIWEAFCRGYMDQHGHLNGVQDAYEWWKNPDLKCMQLEAKQPKWDKRCQKICESCKIFYLRRT